ncbi:MAG: DNA gyrase inhibitor YacG [Succinivibrionaceae bacterium]|nr:DNA gyrase inhibitor YacG [Succinivibrionaceae bacterium]
MLKDLLPEEALEGLGERLRRIAPQGAPARCPQCGKEVDAGPGNPFRPFCSRHCRLMDLAAWADERRYIRADAAEVDEEQWAAGPDPSAGPGVNHG